MSARSHAYYAELRSRDPGLPIYPVGATVIAPDDEAVAGPITGPARTT